LTATVRRIMGLVKNSDGVRIDMVFLGSWIFL